MAELWDQPRRVVLVANEQGLKYEPVKRKAVMAEIGFQLKMWSHWEVGWIILPR